MRLLKNLRKPLPFTAMMLLPLLLVVPQAMAKTPIVSSTYSWQVSCKSSLAGIPGSAVARWNWTQDGKNITGGLAACGWNNPGTGTVPSNANGIIASLSTQIKFCFHSTSTTQSFAPGTVPRITLESSCQASAYGFPVSIKATFTIS